MARVGWRLSAYALMGNHYPLRFKTPKAPLVEDMLDPSQSVNLFLAEPDMKTLSHMYRRAWHTGLKTTYYLRTLQASNIEKSTIDIKKEVRGVAGGTAGESNHGARRATLGGHQGMDCRRSALAMPACKILLRILFSLFAAYTAGAFQMTNPT